MVGTLIAGRFRVTEWRAAPRSFTGVALDTEAGLRRVFVKGSSNARKFETERQQLQRAATAAGLVDRVCVPGLIAIDDERQILVMDFVETECSLLNLVWDAAQGRRGLDVGQARDIGFRLGAWLEAFGAAPQDAPLPDVTALGSGLAEAATSRLGHIQRNRASRLDGAVAARVAEDLRTLPSALIGCSAGVVHGDLNLSNVLLTVDGRVCIIDFADARPSLAVEDLGNVWHTLDVVGTASPKHRRPIESLMEGLAEGVGVTFADLAERADVRLVRLNQALVQVLSVAGMGWLARHVSQRLHWQLGRMNRSWLASSVGSAGGP